MRRSRCEPVPSREERGDSGRDEYHPFGESSLIYMLIVHRGRIFNSIEGVAKTRPVEALSLYRIRKVIERFDELGRLFDGCGILFLIFWE